MAAHSFNYPGYPYGFRSKERMMGVHDHRLETIRQLIEGLLEQEEMELVEQQGLTSDLDN